MGAAEELKEAIEGDVFSDEKTRDTFSRDASLFEVVPQVVVAPRNTEDIQALVRFASEHKDISLTARSGGTGMDGGALSESIVVDFSRYFNKIGEVGADFAVTQPGVFYRDFERETLARGLIMPSFPASREICTVGGMVANNAGGELTLRYGKVEDYVKRLKVVFADGNEHVVKPLSRDELETKMAQGDFEGDLYKRLFELIEQNYDTIKAAKPNVHKNSAGYYLWNVWNPDTGVFDLTKLIVGSQGTLGLITEITFELVTPKKYKELLVIFLRDISLLADVVRVVLNHNPESFESYDDKTFKLVLRYFTGFVRQMGAQNVLKLAWQFLPELKVTLLHGFPRLVLLAEFTGDSEEEVKGQVAAAQQAVAKFRIGTHVVRDEQEAEKYWKIRRESFNLIRYHLKGNEKSVPFIDDLVVRPEKLSEFFPGLYALLAPYKDRMRYALGGHAGDGNFHIYTLMDTDREEVRRMIPEIARKVYDFVLSLDGSITAEHNDGLIRTPFLQQQFGQDVYKLFRETKKIFDPTGIFNPGKKIPVASAEGGHAGQAAGTMEYAFTHIKQSKGHLSGGW